MQIYELHWTSTFQLIGQKTYCEEKITVLKIKGEIRKMVCPLLFRFSNFSLIFRVQLEIIRRNGTAKIK